MVFQARSEHAFHMNFIQADLEANDLIDHGQLHVGAVFLNKDLFRGR